MRGHGDEIAGGIMCAGAAQYSLATTGELLLALDYFISMPQTSTAVITAQMLYEVAMANAAYSMASFRPLTAENLFLDDWRDGDMPLAQYFARQHNYRSPTGIC